jgi:hypothetical protein
VDDEPGQLEPMTTTVEILADLRPLIGTDLGASGWIEIGQGRMPGGAHRRVRRVLGPDPVRGRQPGPLVLRPAPG